MRVCSSPWSSLTALSVLLSFACTASDSPDTASELASVSQAVTELTVMVDGRVNAHDKLRAELNGQPASLDEVLALLGTGSASSPQVFVNQGGSTVEVAGASSTLSARALGFAGLRPTLDAASDTVDTCSTFSVQGALARLCVHLPPTNARKQESPEAQEARAKTEQMIALMDDLAKRYPDPEKVDQAAFAQKEAAQLEKIATLYCEASGLPVPCDPNRAEGGTQEKMQLATKWWQWLIDAFTRVGVIPHTSSCPSAYPLVQMYHDDEDRNNANSRWGWLGGISHNTNTLFRFCSVPGAYFRQLTATGSQYSYSVLKLGLFCPSGASRTVTRFFDNEDNGNANWSSGGMFPNVNVGGNFAMMFCVFEDGLYWPQMSGFANLGFGYGVFAPTNMPAPYSLQAGSLYKDDEDFLNINMWILPPPPPGMSGSNNTSMGLARVK